MRLGVVLSIVVTALVPPRPHHLAVLLLDRIEALPTTATTEQAFTQELNPIRDQVQVAIQDVDADAPESSRALPQAARAPSLGGRDPPDDRAYPGRRA